MAFDMTLEQSLQELMGICRVHEQRLNHALSRITPIMPMNTEKLERMSDDNYAFKDSAVRRFEKIQDTIGKKIFPRILKLEAEFEMSRKLP